MQIFDILLKYKTKFCDGAIFRHFKGKQKSVNQLSVVYFYLL